MSKVSAAACTGHLRASPRFSLQHRQPQSAGLSAQGRWAAVAGGRVPRQLCALVLARRSGRDDFDPNYVAFDDEEDGEQQGTTIQPGLGPVFSTALRGLSAITDKLTDMALQVAPTDASPTVVRVAVNAGLVLLALSFVKSLLSFFLTLGTIILGAYVAVKVFGVDVAGVAPVGGSGGGGRPRPRQQQQKKRKPDPRARQSEFKGLLGSGGEEQDDLLDVWFQRKGDSGSNSSRSRRR